MSVYAYKAVDSNSVTSEGTIVADSARQARDALRSRGLVVRDILQRKEESTTWKVLTRKRSSATRTTMAIRELATLLSVGVPLVEAVETVSKQYRGAFRTCLLLLKDRIAAGASLAEAMAQQPGVFDELTVRMVEVGEFRKSGSSARTAGRFQGAIAPAEGSRRQRLALPTDCAGDEPGCHHVFDDGCRSHAAGEPCRDGPAAALADQSATATQ